MDFHPLSMIFPLLEGKELDAVATSIKINGLQNSITTFENAILDGRNRFRACEKVGVTPKYEPFTGSNPLAFVIDQNLHRRHLDESQRAMVAARIAKLEEGRPRKTAPIGAVSQERAAEHLNVSRRSVQRARKVLAEGGAETVAKVAQGNLAVSRAAHDIEKAKQHKAEAAEEAGSAAERGTLVDRAAKGEKVSARPRSTARQITSEQWRADFSTLLKKAPTGADREWAAAQLAETVSGGDCPAIPEFLLRDPKARVDAVIEMAGPLAVVEAALPRLTPEIRSELIGRLVSSSTA